MGSKTYNVHLSTETKDYNLPGLTQDQFRTIQKWWYSGDENTTPAMVMPGSYGYTQIVSLKRNGTNVAILKAEEVSG